MPPRRAAIYLRVSTGSQVKGTSIGTQRKAARAWINSKGWQFVGEYADRGQSGAKDRRPELDRLLEDCRAGKIDAIVVAKLDRFSRSKTHLERVLEELDGLGVVLSSVSESFESTSASDRAFRSILGVFAAFERDLIIERTVTGQRAKAERGDWPVGIAPYGYRLEGQRRDARCVIDENEASMLRQVTAWIVDDGLTTGQAAIRLNSLGMTPRKAAAWEHTNLLRVLRNESLMGKVVYAKATPYGRSLKGHHSTGRFGSPIEIRLPPILTQERFEALQIALSRKAHGRRRGNKVYPLTGRIQGLCGGTFSGIWRANRDLRQYRCRYDRWSASRQRCVDRSIRADAVEDAVWNEVSALLAEPERLHAMAHDYLELRAGQVGVEKDESENIERRIAERQRALTETVVSYAKAGVEPELLELATSEIRDELNELIRYRAQLESWRAESRAESRQVQDARALAGIASDRLSRMTLEEKSEVFRLLDVRVKIAQYEPSLSLEVSGSVVHRLLLQQIGGGDLEDGALRCSTCFRR